MARNVPLISGVTAVGVTVAACFAIWPLETVYVVVVLILSYLAYLFAERV